ncbi:N-terminal L-serine N(alpha)-acetyltransferase NAT4 [Aspergillus brunneoviolaceus CBS 621.78]|uniref:Acyl-CoA N-acyltransferase n=1 Tax=Aspergillus brunneoviolaceus CBS 621.78 TaxID=1450534 RepID=A0ACD1GQ30_9EURO|nr:acyl-CoA N-acyltransferase [Aspergillus brunneoviolaceus CBS 621.78]RAH51366.1 acyl-CoA N-acyltransferase [Aspergillus brunneoviolaceus CBS 621.78]
MPTTSSHRVTKPPTNSKRGIRRASRKPTQPTSTSPTLQSQSQHEASQIEPRNQPTPPPQPQPTQPLVERTNALPLAEFINLYVPKEDLHITSQVNTEEQQQQQQQHYTITLYTAATLPPTLFTQCFQLIETTSADAYRASSIGWSPPKKRKEMQLPDIKYLVLRRATPQSRETRPENEQEDEEVLGFLSFMVTYEDGFEVVYCYEVHLAASVQRQGLGAQLMRVFLRIGERLGMAKAMLTVFRANGAAIRFYERLGFGVDESSPRPRRLRNGTVKDPDYRILSRVYARERWATE